MNINEEVLKNKNKIKLIEVKLEALINLLSKEGVITHQEVEEEVEKLIEDAGR